MTVYSADEFILQIDKATFEPVLAKIEDALKRFGGHAAITDVDETGAQLYHPNGRQNEPVYRITFTGPSDREVWGLLSCRKPDGEYRVGRTLQFDAAA